MTTIPTFGTYTAPEVTEGDQYRPYENYGKALIVKTKQRKEGIITKNSPDGGPGVIVDLVELDSGEVFRDVLWMSGAIVDGLSQYANKEVVVITFEPRQSKNGRTYPSPVNASDADIARARQYYATHGDPFAPKFGSLTEPAPAAAVASVPGMPAGLTPEQIAAMKNYFAAQNAS
jgi:hypothetical protein